jgi:hypothetical protein
MVLRFGLSSALISHSDDYVSLLAPFFNIPVSLGSLFHPEVIHGATVRR